MSAWDHYVTYLQQQAPGNCIGGAIFGLDGTQWAASDDCRMTDPSQASKVANAFSSVGSSFTLAAGKFMILRADNDPAEGNLASFYARCGAKGLICVKTGQLIVCGEHEQDVTRNATETAVYNLGNYLISNGY
ncbi:hypothetical protein RCL1_002183 [Eukaryota sp. TZLM3-RCL]